MLEMSCQNFVKRIHCCTTRNDASLVNCVCSPWAAIGPSQPIPQFLYREWHSQRELLASSNQQLWPWSFLASFALPCWQSVGNREVLDMGQALLSKANTLMCYQHYSAKSKTHLQLLYQLLERKLPLSQLKPGQTALTEYSHALIKKKKIRSHWDQVVTLKDFTPKSMVLCLENLIEKHPQLHSLQGHLRTNTTLVAFRLFKWAI